MIGLICVNGYSWGAADTGRGGVECKVRKSGIVGLFVMPPPPGGDTAWNAVRGEVTGLTPIPPCLGPFPGGRTGNWNPVVYLGMGGTDWTRFGCILLNDEGWKLLDGKEVYSRLEGLGPPAPGAGGEKKDLPRNDCCCCC